MDAKITTIATTRAMHQMQVAQAEVKAAPLEAPTLDPETRSRLMQLGRLAHGMRNAAAQQLPLTGELAANGLSAVGPATAEALNDAVAMEEFKRKKQKESDLVVGLRQALHNSSRSQADFLRGLVFLMPQIGPHIEVEDEDFVGLPGFESPMDAPDVDAGGLVWNSHADFFAQISALLEALKTEWLSKYQDSLATFLEFYQEFSDIMEEIKTKASGDKGDVLVDFSDAHPALKALAERYGLDANSLANFNSKQGAEAFKQSLGLPGLKVTGPDFSGRWHVKMDTSAVTDLMKSMESGFTPGHPWPEGETMDSAQYAAWVSAKDSNMEQIKHVSKVLGEKLNEMTQKFDNIVKILSSTIDRMTEANKAYVGNT